MAKESFGEKKRLFARDLKSLNSKGGGRGEMGKGERKRVSSCFSLKNNREGEISSRTGESPISHTKREK